METRHIILIVLLSLLVIGNAIDFFYRKEWVSPSELKDIINQRDKAIRKVFNADLMGLLDQVDKLRKVVEAARECEAAFNHVGTCAYMRDYRGCTCGHIELVNAIKAMEG